MRLQLKSEFLLAEWTVLDPGSLSRRLGDGAGAETELDLFASLVVGDIWCRNAFHPEDFDFVTIAARECVLDSRETVKWKECYEILNGRALVSAYTHFSGSNL
jgi:hypothetical protein